MRQEKKTIVLSLSFSASKPSVSSRNNPSNSTSTPPSSSYSTTAAVNNQSTIIASQTETSIRVCSYLNVKLISISQPFLH